MIIDDEELRNLYQVSGEEHLQKLEAGLLHLENHSDDAVILTELLREVHGLKGDSRSLGVESVERLSRQIEDILKCVQRQEIELTLQVSNCLYQGLTAIGQLVHEAVSGEPSGIDTAQILDTLITIASEAVVPQPGTISYPDSEFQRFSALIDDEELRDIYKTTSQERLEKLAAELLHLEQHPEDDANLDRMLREIHSLKGDSRSAGIETVASLAYQVEDLLKGIKHQEIALTTPLTDCLHQGLDAISQLVQEATTGDPSEIDMNQILNHWMTIASEVIVPQQDVTPETDTVSQRLSSDPETKELWQIYKTASEERLQKLESGLLHLERYPEDKETLAELLREAHSLKGDSRTVGLLSVETLTHQIEDILGIIQRQGIVLTSQTSDSLYQGLDAIGQLVYEAITGESSGVDVAQVLDRLMAFAPESTVSEPELLELEQQSDLALPLAQASDQDAPSLQVSEPYRVDTIRVHTGELDALMTQTEELTVTRIQIAQMTTEIEQLVSLWEEWKTSKSKTRSLHPASFGTNPYEETFEKLINNLRTSSQENNTKLNIISKELGDKVRTLRLLPLSTVFQAFPRMVRDLAKQQSKWVELILEGGEITVDKHILENIKDSLMHLIRNAIDHGIETPTERERSGKPASASIWLRGYQTITSTVIEVADDGRGLDTEKIKQTAAKRGLYSLEQLETMALSQIHALILAPGFSTQTFITEISGRGIGLDVVRNYVDQLKGNVQIESTPGQGSTFRIQFSTSLATTNVMLVDVQGIVHALPIEFVQTSLLVSPDQIVTVEGQDTLILGDQTIPIAKLVDLLEFSNSPAYAVATSIEPQRSNLRPCILLQVGEDQAGFFVDHLLDTQEVVFKPLSPLLKRVRNVAGATILGTGEVCMILNPPDLLRSLQKATRPVAPAKPKEISRTKPVILLVEDSLLVRTQEKRLLENAGYEVVIAVDGVEGYNTLRTRTFDAVVSDVEMPNLDGLSLTAKIRQHQEYRGLPIILVTTLSSDDDRRRGAEAGANAYVAKGKFNQDFLLETLAKLI